SIVVFQTYINEERIIDEIYDSGQSISYYTDIIKKKPWFPQLTHIILPHDAEVKDLTSGKTRLQVFQEELPGIDFTVLARIPINDGIEAVRQMLKTLWIDKKCAYIRDCIKSYKKEWDDKRSRWRDKPEHNEHSNGADSVRYMALGRRKYKEMLHKRAKGAGHKTSMDV